ncbi:MAG: tetratricopeptide repeat protein [Pseudobdellovibrio sp.]
MKFVLVGISLFVFSCSSSPKTETAPSVPPPEIKKADKKSDVAQDDRPATAKAAEVKTEAPKPVKYDALNAAIAANNDEKIKAAAIEVLQSNSKDTKALNALAMSAFRKGHTDAAVLILEKVLTIDPKSSSASSNMGLISLSRNEKHDAIESFKKALEFDPNNAVAAMNLGSIYIKENDYAKTVIALDQTVSNGKADENSMNNYAIALAATGKAQAAADIYEKILKKNSSNKNVMLNLAIVLIEKLNKNEEGLDLVNRLKFVGADSDARQVIKDLEIKAKAGLK